MRYRIVLFPTIYKTHLQVTIILLRCLCLPLAIFRRLNYNLSRSKSVFGKFWVIFSPPFNKYIFRSVKKSGISSDCLLKWLIYFSRQLLALVFCFKPVLMFIIAYWTFPALFLLLLIPIFVWRKLHFWLTSALVNRYIFKVKKSLNQPPPLFKSLHFQIYYKH